MVNKGKRSTIRCSPPLPFQGNKSIGRVKFLEIVKRIKDGNKKTFVDLFGGSLYLSYLIHQVFPEAKVICNDYDNYKQRLDNIAKTQTLLNKMKEVVTEKRYKKIGDENKAKIDEIIRAEEGFVDFITLSSNLLYSSFTLYDKEKFLAHEYYNILAKTEYNPDVADYLEGLELVKEDWKTLFDKYKDKENVIFIADPPYLYTDRQGYMYHNKQNWGVRENLQVLDVMKTPAYIYYCSGKPGTRDFVSYLHDVVKVIPDFEEIEYKRGKTINKRSGPNREVMMYHLDLNDPEPEPEPKPKRTRKPKKVVEKIEPEPEPVVEEDVLPEEEELYEAEYDPEYDDNLNDDNYYIDE